MPREGLDKNSLRIRITGLSNGIHEYDFSADPSSIGLDGNFLSPVVLHARLDKATRQILFKMNITTTGKFRCDRCLDEFQQPVTTAYSLVYLYDTQDAAQYKEEEVQLMTPDTVYIDPTEDVRQMIMLSIPLKLLCREECKGLCSRCGENLNNTTCTCEQSTVDPRWDALQGYLDH